MKNSPLSVGCQPRTSSRLYPRRGYYLIYRLPIGGVAQLHNRPDKLPQHRALRQAATPAETVLWRALQGAQIDGRKFRRQHGIGPFIVDFYCPAKNLVIELDGAPHFSAASSLADES